MMFQFSFTWDVGWAHFVEKADLEHADCQCI